jgi:hypothetical protein
VAKRRFREAEGRGAAGRLPRRLSGSGLKVPAAARCSGFGAGLIVRRAVRLLRSARHLSDRTVGSAAMVGTTARAAAVENRGAERLRKVTRDS